MCCVSGVAWRSSVIVARRDGRGGSVSAGGAPKAERFVVAKAEAEDDAWCCCCCPRGPLLACGDACGLRGFSVFSLLGCGVKRKVVGRGGGGAEGGDLVYK